MAKAAEQTACGTLTGLRQRRWRRKRRRESSTGLARGNCQYAAVLLRDVQLRAKLSITSRHDEPVDRESSILDMHGELESLGQKISQHRQQPPIRSALGLRDD